MLPVRPLSFREYVDLPFALIQADIRQLATTCAVGVTTTVIVAVGATLVTAVLTHSSDSAMTVAALLATVVTGWLLRVFVRGTAVPIALARVYRQRISTRQLLRRLGATLGTQVRYQLSYTLLGLGVTLLGLVAVVTLLPAWYWLGWLRGQRMLVIALLLDGHRPYAAARRQARVLVAGARGRVAWLWLSLRALLVTLIVPLFGGLLFVAKFSGTHRWAMITLAIAAALLLAAGTELVESMAAVVVLVDRRCRREAWDLRQSAPASPALVL